jgi:uncharacterized protein YegP (UPF0339 family)
MGLKNNKMVRKTLLNYEYWKSEKDQQWYFNLVHPDNGDVLITSEGYTTKRNKTVGMNSVRVNGKVKQMYVISPSLKGEKWYFILKATNGKTIGRSKMYTTKEHCEDAVLDSLRYA